LDLGQSIAAAWAQGAGGTGRPGDGVVLQREGSLELYSDE